MNYNINLIDNIILDDITNTSKFIEFSNIMDELTYLTDVNLYIEAVKDETPNLRKFGNEIKKNTVETTKDVIHSYGNIVNANSNLIKSSWDVIMRAINLLSRATGFILDKISDIPKIILKVGDRAIGIPNEVKNKIKGNITLYITAGDIEMIYNKLLIHRLTEYISLMTELSKGNFWSTLLKKRVSEDSNKSSAIIGTNDMKLCKKMDELYDHLKNTEFKPTIIQMNDESIVNTYFGDSKSIKFTDNYGKSHTCSYYEAITLLIKDLENKKEDLKTTHLKIGDKLSKTEANQTYNKLDNHSKYIINKTISQISKVSTIIGNIIKYITIDLDTINKNINKMIKGKDSSDVNIKKAVNKSADKINYKL